MSGIPESPSHRSSEMEALRHDGKERSMRAITFSRFGSPDVLTTSVVPRPDVGPGQVGIAVKAAAINPVDAKIRRGELEAIFPTRFPAIPGSDVAGIVESVGEGVSDVQVGDRVLGIAASGAYAEHAVIEQYAVKPAEISWDLAASLPVVGEAALRLVDQLSLSPGETLLVIGGAGSVGSLVTQLAVRAGIRVIGAAREDDHGYVRSLGAEPVDYGSDLVPNVQVLAPEGVAAALDTSGAGVLPQAIALTGDPNRVITTADVRAPDYGVRFSVPSRAGEAAQRAAGEDPGSSTPAAPATTSNPLQALVDAYRDQPFQLRIAAAYPLPSAAQAHRDLEAGARGKLVLRVDQLAREAA